MGKTNTKRRPFEDVISDIRQAVFAVTRHRPAPAPLAAAGAFQGWSLGSGFFVSPRVFLTCAHVLMHPANPHVDGDRYDLVNISATGQISVVQVNNAVVGTNVHVFLDADLAILLLEDNQDRQYLPLEYGTIRVGSEIGVAGYPLSNLNVVDGALMYDGLIFRAAKNALTATYTTTFPTDTGVSLTNIPVIEVNFLFVPGNSGGPIFSAEKGRVLGFVHGYRLQKIKEQVETVSLIPNMPVGMSTSYILHENALYSIGIGLGRIRQHIEAFGVLL